MLMMIAYLAQTGRRFLEVILHIGAHRTGTTSFQHMLDQNRLNLMKNDTTVWGPRVTRGGRFDGMFQPWDAAGANSQRRIKRSQGIIKIEMGRLKSAGQNALLVSEENIIGSMRANLRSLTLYAGLDVRLERFARVFGDVVSRVGIAIRPYGDFWASSLAYAISAGHRPLDARALDLLVSSQRGWCDVISDVAKIFPKAEVTVWEFDRLIGKPEMQYLLLARGRGRLKAMPQRLNMSPDRQALREILALRGDQNINSIAPGAGRYMPFNAHQRLAFDARYQDDISWLRAQHRYFFNDTDIASPVNGAALKAVGGRFV